MDQDGWWFYATQLSVLYRPFKKQWTPNLVANLIKRPGLLSDAQTKYVGFPSAGELFFFPGYFSVFQISSCENIDEPPQRSTWTPTEYGFKTLQLTALTPDSIIGPQQLKATVYEFMHFLVS